MLKMENLLVQNFRSPDFLYLLSVSGVVKRFIAIAIFFGVLILLVYLNFLGMI